MEMKINSKNRIDDANEKRVELHTHTKMSRYDSVVSAKDLIMTAARWGWDAIAITDHGVTQAFPEAVKTVIENNLNLKVIYGMEGYMTGEDYKQGRANHVSILAKNIEGIYNLNELVRLSFRHMFRQNRIPKKKINEYREGLLIGSACIAGELFQAIIKGYSDEKLIKIANFYDYLEVQPLGYYMHYMLYDNYWIQSFKTEDEVQKVICKIIELGERLNKLVVATSDVHFLDEEDADIRAVLKHAMGFHDADKQPPCFLRTTKEMLDKFSFLGNKKAYDIVVKNPRLLADMIEKIVPMPTGDDTKLMLNLNDVDKMEPWDDGVFRMSVIKKIDKVTAESYLRRYIEERKVNFSDEKIKDILDGITGVKAYTDVHGDIIINVPYRIYKLLPTQILPSTNICISHYDSNAFLNFRDEKI
jgi:DNA polymerase-3 subunit alpha (Gram-positive type)